MDFGVVIAAAGLGKRMGHAEKKQFIELAGKPVLYHTVTIFHEIPEIGEIVIVTNQEDIERTKKLLHGFSRVKVIPGGAERQESVYLGLGALESAEYVLIHDAARPFATEALIRTIMDSVVKKEAAIPAVPVKDTIKMVDEERDVVSTPPRQSLWAVQTPQAFRLSTILEAHRLAKQEGFLGTDDAMLLEWQGKKVSVVDGEYTNIKLTTPDDLKLGETIIEKRRR